jgi:chromosome segregation ATPase
LGQWQKFLLLFSKRSASFLGTLAVLERNSATSKGQNCPALAKDNTMSSRIHKSYALLGAIMMAVPLAPALAQSNNAMSQHQARAEAHEQSVDQRISTLHEQLKITPAEETKWDAVAQTMRDNAADMEKLAASKASQSQEGMTAVEDLQTYMQFAQAHVDGLKKLTASFQALYDSMPDSQKKIADEVFQQSHRHENSTAG